MDLKIFLFDIEVSPSVGYVWEKYETDVIDFIEEWYMLSFAYKWLGHKTKAYSLPDFTGYAKRKHSDKALVTKLHELMTDADLIVAHNGDRFDMRKSNARFLKYGLEPIPPIKTIDTLKVAKKYFSFNSNKLNDLCTHLELGQKEKTGGFDLWKGCMDGDMKSWRKMVKYNKTDVDILEKLYLELRPWINNHPKLSFKDKTCTNCGSRNLKEKGILVTSLGRYERFQCQDCGHWNKGRAVVRGSRE